MRGKKVRGIKRRIRTMHKRFTMKITEFPVDQFYNGYWSMLLPVDWVLMNSKKVSKKVKSLCMQAMIDHASRLTKLKPHDGEEYKVVVLIDPPDFWNCQIIIFKGDSYFNSFFNRQGPYQYWDQLNE